MVQARYGLAGRLPGHPAGRRGDRRRLRDGAQLRRLHDERALEDLLDGKAWVAYEFDGEPLHPEHGGPARLLVPHLYLWKSAKWVRGLVLSDTEDLGFWETAGYHEYGDPWKEQRYAGD